ncbi:MAG TPA: peptidase M18 [Clostridia bacterium]|nr:peptidase M18 [Clostridia bacterium]
MSLRNIVISVALLAFALSAPAQEDSGSVWNTKKSAWQQLTPAQRTQVSQFAESYKSYLDTARTAQASTREMIRQARDAGFAEFTSAAQVKSGAKLIFNNRDRAVILAVIGSEPLSAGSRVVAAHHDSPHLDLKARPIISRGSFVLLKTIYYGGIKKYQWANIPLALIGRIDTTDGRSVNVSLGTKPGEPVFVIPDNAVHSDKPLRTRTYNDALLGEELNPVFGSVPGERSSAATEVLRQLSEAYKIKEEDLVSAELQLVPAASPSDVGFDRGLIGAYGQDDRLSSYCAARAIMEMKAIPRFTAMAYLTNFEEEGSVNNTGASSAFLNNTFAQLTAAQRGQHYTEFDLRTALRNSRVISADANDGYNPIFGEATSESSNAARLGYGVAIKAYGTGFNANSEYIAAIRGLLDGNQIPWQTQTPKVDIGGGGTIGGFLSRQDMEVIDLGVPLLSMHSPYEMSSKVDVWNFYRIMSAFYPWEGK